MRERPFIATYLLASARNGTLYCGVTSDLISRVHQHKTKLFGGFSARYGVDRLVWYESFERMTNAIAREHTIKGYSRQWKLNLIERSNPEWRDLYDDLLSPRVEHAPELNAYAHLDRS